MTRKMRVWLHSKPGTWTFYKGYVDVDVTEDEDAFVAAVAKLARTSFPERSSPDSWKLDRVERRA